MIVILYLAVVVVANLTVTAFGPPAVLPVAFALVGFTMVGRDRLHDAWHGRGLRWKMTALVATGGALSFALNADALRIAVASSVAFAVSEAVNALVYAPMLRRDVPWLARVNAGNAPNALVDSALFIGIAFGWMPGLMLLQALVKIGGGFLWSVVFVRLKLVTACVAVLVFVPVVAQAQVLSVGSGVVSTEHGGEFMADVFGASPVIAGLRGSAVVSWSGEVAVLTKVSRTLVQDGPGFVNAEVGASWLKFRDYSPEPFVGLYASAPLPLPRTSLAGAVSVDPWDEWGWAAVVRFDVLLWMR